ncbi:hypothetical protein B9Z55_007620 [Caenorhabditis nigoni]|uniref:Uncharacterized protein n=1 Tax=Caenorhabditis nigoni TaxID=1611254 RepID=A0A2G5VAS6_9PELO|nr:hypothetical protein B9Z55_007620 [Caenorhabditis nigoni]
MFTIRWRAKIFERLLYERHRRDLNREEPTGDANDNLQGEQLARRNEHTAQRNEEEDDVVEAADEDQELQQTPQAVAIGEDERNHDVDSLAIQEAMPEIHPPMPENLEDVQEMSKISKTIKMARNCQIHEQCHQKLNKSQESMQTSN